MSLLLDIFFGVQGKGVSADHGYALYGAVARVLETPEDAWLHQLDEVGFFVAAIVRTVGSCLGRARVSD
jgi:hypothetical protein